MSGTEDRESDRVGSRSSAGIQVLFEDTQVEIEDLARVGIEIVDRAVEVHLYIGLEGTNGISEYNCSHDHDMMINDESSISTVKHSRRIGGNKGGGLNACWHVRMSLVGIKEGL